METVGGEVPLWFVCVVVIPFLGIVVFLIFIVGHEMEIGVLRKRRRRFGSGECVDLVQLAYDLYVTQPPAHEHYVYKSFRRPLDALMTSRSGPLFCLFLLGLAASARGQKPSETLLGLPPLPAYFEDDEPTTVEKAAATTTAKPRKTPNPFTLSVYSPLPPHRNFLFPDAPYLVNNIPELPPQHESKYKGRYDDDGVFHPDDEEPKASKEAKETKKAQALGAKIQKTEDSAEEADTDTEEAEGSRETTPTPLATTPQPMQQHLPIKKLSALRENIHSIAESSSVPPSASEEPPEAVAVTSSIPVPPSKTTRKMVEVAASAVDDERRLPPVALPHPTFIPTGEFVDALPRQSPNAIGDIPVTKTPRGAAGAKRIGGFKARRLQPQARRKITTIVPQTQPVESFEQDNKITEAPRASTVTRKVQNTHAELPETSLTRTTTQVPPRRPRPHGSRPFRRGIRPKAPLQRRLNENRPPAQQNVAPPPLIRKDGHQGLPQAQPLPPEARRPPPPPPPPRGPPVQLPPQPPGRRPEDAAYMAELELYDWSVFQRANSRGRFTAQSQPTFENSGDARFLRELDDYDALEHQQHFTDNPPQLRVNLPTTTLPPVNDRQELIPLRNGDVNSNGNGNGNQNSFIPNVNNNNNFNGFANRGSQPDNGNFIHNIFNPNLFNQGGQGFFNGAQQVTPHPLLNVFSLFTFPQGRR